MTTYTADSLIARVKLYSSIPSIQPGYNDTKILDFLNQHMQNIVAALMVSEREDYLVKFVDVPLPDVGANTFSELVLFPERAVGNKLREVKYAGINNPSSLINIPKIELEEIDGNVYPFAFRNYPYAYGFITEGDGIRIINPGGFSSFFLRMYYYQRPSDLVLESAAAKITSIDTGTFTYTVDAVPSTIVTGSVVDMVRSTPPLRTNAQDQVVTNVVGNMISFASLPSTLMKVGDYIALATESPVPFIPKESFDYLVQGAVLKVLEAQGDGGPGTQLALAKLEEYKATMMDLLSPRVDGEIETIGTRDTML